MASIENDSATNFKPEKVKKPGIIYLSTIPYGMNETSIRAYFSSHGKITKMFLQKPHKESYVDGKVMGAPKGNSKYQQKSGLIKGRIQYTEGWIQFSSRKDAKSVAEMFNNRLVGGKKKALYYDCLWNIKYLGKSFKWEYLRRRVRSENELRKRKMVNETDKISQEAEQYIKASEIAERLEKKNSLKDNSAVNVKACGIKQRLTEEQILEKQRLKKKKEEKFKNKIQKKKIKRQEKKIENSKQKVETAKSLKMFSSAS